MVSLEKAHRFVLLSRSETLLWVFVEEGKVALICMALMLSYVRWDANQAASPGGRRGYL